MAMNGRPRKIKSPKAMADAWETYKDLCDNRIVKKTEFSSKEACFITQEIPASVSYTIEGFCSWLGLARSAFYDTYDTDPRFSDILARMRGDCERDVREKFELGIIPTQLSALWMSKFGYSTKTEQNVTGAVPVVISGNDDLED